MKRFKNSPGSLAWKFNQETFQLGGTPKGFRMVIQEISKEQRVV